VLVGEFRKPKLIYLSKKEKKKAEAILFPRVHHHTYNDVTPKQNGEMYRPTFSLS